MHRLCYKDIVTAALKEDLAAGDLTTESIFDSNQIAKVEILAREGGIVAGLPVVGEVFQQIDIKTSFKPHFQDGDVIKPQETLASIEGRIASILSAERVALNFLQRLSGIATATQEAVEIIASTKAKITDTRKTTPNLRVLEKYAVRMGGGENHRFNLSDMILIKDNHIKGAGSLSRAVELARKSKGFPVKIEVEAANLNQVKEALSCGADIVMLDNMTVNQMKEAVLIIKGQALVEASGKITKDKLLDTALTGVDLISLGYLTYGSKALDLSLNVK